MNVLTKREDFRIGLAIILIIFTGGLGLLIYAAIYLDKPKNRCVHCNSVCNVQLITSQPNSNYQVITTSNQILSQKSVGQTMVVEGSAKYCFNCGVELHSNEDAKFCGFCGTNIQ